MSSPPSSPPSRRSSQQGSQLLQELEVLSQALYQAQRKGFPPQQSQGQAQAPSPSPKKSSFLSRRETLPARRFSFYEPNKDISTHHDPIPLPGLASHDTPLPFTRHSMSVSQVPASLEQKQQPPSNVRPRFPSSTVPSQPLPAWSEEKPSDNRSRLDRRLSQPWPAKSSDKFTPDEPDWSDDAPDPSRKLDSSAEKKKSIWSWKPLRALSHIGRQRFHCVFSAYVHAIEGLPQAMNGLRLCVHMRKEETKDDAVQTMPSRVFQGIAEFEETLFMKCTLYSSKGPSHSLKFMSKAFIVSVMAPDVEELDLGKHQLDLSRLLADNVDEKKGGPERGNSWDTTLDLSGKAKGGKLIITFNYEILDKDSATSTSSSSRFRGSPTHRSSMRTSYSLPNSAHGTPRTTTLRGHSNHSPSVSEPGNDYGDGLAIEHLNLDDPSSLEGAYDLKGQQATEEQHIPAVYPQFERRSPHSHDAFNAFPNFEPKLKVDQGLAPPTPRQSVENANIERNTKIADTVSEKDEADEALTEDEAEFVVVDQGTEIDKSVESPMDEGECMKKAVQDDLDDLTQLPEDNQEQRGLEADKEVQLLSTQAKTTTNSLDLLENRSGKSGVDVEENEKTANVQEGEKKDTVTYQMVMRTLESLLQGTSAKEQPQEEILDDLSELGQHAATGRLGEEDGAQKQVINIANTQSMDDKSDTVGTTNVQGIAGRAVEQKGLHENVDDEADLVAGEFLHMLESGENPLGRNADSEPDSPRARLLKQFEQEALLDGGFGIDLDLPEVPDLFLDDASNDTDLGPGIASTSSSNRAVAASTFEKTPKWDCDEDKELSSIMEAAESELQRATQSMRSKTRAKMLEDAETEALMQEWGLNEKAFVSSPPKQAFKQQEPPPLAKGLGPAISVKDGGSLRSMNPLHFQSNKGSGKLIMQVSKPVVLPAEMGSGTVDILRNMASMGIENMAIQAMTAMPLEDVTGKSVEQIAIEGMSAGRLFRNGRRALEGLSGVKSLSQETSRNDKKFGPTSHDNDELVSLDDLAPMAMQQIEALAVDGLKIQSDMTEEDAPYALNSFSMEGELGKRDMPREGTMGTLKGVTGVHLLKGAKAPVETSGGGNGLMDMAITLDEWMLLDAGLYDETENSKDALALMAAHHAVHQDLVVHGRDNEKIIGGRKQQNSRNNGQWGCMGNTLTIAMLVQLRDPLRNNEAVGAPMMAFVQAERMVIPPKPKVGRTVSMKGNSEDEEADSETEPQFKITGVHMAGLKPPQDGKKPGWGNQKQQQTGSCWLIANGMSKSSKGHPLLKSKPTSTATSGKVKVKQGETLWSISARVHGSGNKWKDLMKLNPHIRNPDVIYENQTIRTK